MIQLTASGPRIVKDGEWIAQQRDFAQRHCAVLKGFVEASILNRIPSMLEACKFFAAEHTTGESKVFSKEFTMQNTDLLPQVLFLLLNNSRLLKGMAEFTGSEKSVRHFDGRGNKRCPGGEHYASWHNDDVVDRLYGLTINLSPRPFRGGDFEIRDKATKKVLHKVSESRFGDAFLFRIQHSLEHRVRPVQGDVPRYAYSGWFFGCTDYPEVVRRQIQPLEE